MTDEVVLHARVNVSENTREKAMCVSAMSPNDVVFGEKISLNLIIFSLRKVNVRV